ncbi:MAG TPA: TetR/AcrR family transcriptional regulator [Candidatus Atribacteria bacterium]|nr:TetR/AcrR family transcriptional regulator [Candidatus Atribacteria bacterium]HPT78366.1 TetR/AcrR family transcriptional regulator [Candidatus Atribacteria bacterium]
MDQPREYSEKEISIFEGIMALLNRGYRLHELKVADIAAAAGMGKSTAYEYFESKEELIREAVHYHVHKEYREFKSFVSKHKGLVDILRNTMDYLVDMLDTRFSGLLLMFLNLGQSELAQLIYEDPGMLTAIREGVDEQIDTILATGKKEGLIAKEISADDCRLILNGFLSAFCNEVIFLNKGILPRLSLQPPEKAADVEVVSTEQGHMSVRSDDELIKALKDRTMKLMLKALR